MLFKINEKTFTTYYKDGIHYLYADTNMFGDKLRLGDFTMYSTMLFCLKQYLINKSPEKFNQSNLYFVLNRLGGLMIGDLNSTLALFPNIWRGHTVNRNGTNNVRQCVSGGNIWSFKTYLTDNNIKLDDAQFNRHHVVDPSSFHLTENPNKKRVYIFPVQGKEYNIERNMSIRDIAKIVKQIPYSSNITVITKDSDIDVDRLRKALDNRIEILDNCSWLEIILTLMSECKLFISGDCGLSHLVSMFHKDYKPSLLLYYRTNEFRMTNPSNSFDKVVDRINFIPYSPYSNDSMEVKRF